MRGVLNIKNRKYWVYFCSSYETEEIFFIPPSVSTDLFWHIVLLYQGRYSSICAKLSVWDSFTLHLVLFLLLSYWLHRIFLQKEFMVFSCFCFPQRESAVSFILLKGGKLANMLVSALKYSECRFKAAKLTGDTVALCDFSGGKTSSRYIQFAALSVLWIQLSAK